MHRFKGLIPPLVSAGLIAWLLWRVPLPRLVRASAEISWLPLVVVTCLLVVGLFFWDGLCVWWLFADRGRRLSYGTVLRARGCAYLFTIFHFGLGQGLLAWLMAKVQDKSLLSAAGRCLVMAYVDLGVLLSLGLLGASLSRDPRTAGIATFCTLALLAVLGLTLLARLVPAGAVDRLKTTRWAAEWKAADLNWRRVLPLYLFRTVYFILGMLHAGAALWICGFRLDHTVILSVIPMTALVDGLPISVSGLGTREVMLITFLRPENTAVLLACSLIWWAVVVSGRALIGMGILWIPQTRTLLAARSSAE